ncbi:hypothetical protein [Zavarzinella formosa]|uniref:hypothetical protein n=1 Tax=Zavarzinella formosa TaxID=360055 RepID=UPI0002D57CC4|nr:hypothetical protein [Zavarzinella formosa]
MSHYLADPAELPDGGLRYSESFSIMSLSGLVLSGVFALVSENPEWYAIPWMLLAMLFVCRPGLTLARGRIGVACRAGPWWLWARSRPADWVRRIVVRSGDNSDSMLVICGDQGKPLILKWTVSRDCLMRAANSLAGRMGVGGNAVSVVEERVGFTGERTGQPCLSRVNAREEANGLVFPVRTTWKLVSPPNPDAWNRGPQSIPGGLLLFMGVVLVAASVCGMVLHLTGRGHQFIVGIGPFVFGPPSHPNLLIRFAEALVKGSLGMLFGLPLAVVGWQLIRPIWALSDAIRYVRNRPGGRGRIEIIVNKEDLAIRRPDGREIIRWARSEVASVRATRLVSTITNESGDTTQILGGLQIQAVDGREWLCQNERRPTPEDWEWIATRLRATLEAENDPREK